MLETIKKEWQAKLGVVIFLLFSAWWIINNFVLDPKSVRYDRFGDFSDLYGIMALLGGAWGLIISKRWGFTKSIMGKAILMFSLGLLAQEFGQISYSLYYDLLGTPGPYPSIGDAGFFGSIPLYIIGIILLARASGVQFTLKKVSHIVQVVVLPGGMLLLSYVLFLQGYKFDWSQPIKIFLDFGYPFGQAIYISLALLTYLLSRNVLGGIMRNKILFILFALCIQFLSDYTFLYQSSRGTWKVGEINDYMYLVAYLFMTLGLLQLQTVLRKLRA